MSGLDVVEGRSEFVVIDAADFKGELAVLFGFDFFFEEEADTGFDGEVVRLFGNEVVFAVSFVKSVFGIAEGVEHKGGFEFGVAVEVNGVAEFVGEAVEEVGDVRFPVGAAVVFAVTVAEA